MGFNNLGWLGQNLAEAKLEKFPIDEQKNLPQCFTTVFKPKKREKKKELAYLSLFDLNHAN